MKGLAQVILTYKNRLSAKYDSHYFSYLGQNKKSRSVLLQGNHEKDCDEIMEQLHAELIEYEESK